MAQPVDERDDRVDVVSILPDSAIVSNEEIIENHLVEDKQTYPDVPKETE